jgi:hypothetical protein
MAASPHPAAPHDLPSFITAPGETDTFMVLMGLFLLLAVLGFGVLFLRLHTLPERIAHTRHKLQFEIVAVLGLIALFTHIHIFWIAALLLAMIDLPDFGTPLNRIAGSAEKIAGIKFGEGVYNEASTSIGQIGEAAHVPSKASAGVGHNDGGGPLATPEIAAVRQGEPSHA